MRIVCISDTHSLHSIIDGGIPAGDVLIHAGDITARSNVHDLRDFLTWISLQPHAHKIFIAGNHDGIFQHQAVLARELVARFPDVTYLQDSGCQIGDLSVFGVPWQPEFGDWYFNLPRGKALAKKWDAVPSSTDILITHGPPHGILDLCPDMNVRSTLVHVGCEDLRHALRRIRPRLHVFGHIHEGYGRIECDGTVFVNASSLDRFYRPVHPPIVVDL